MNPSDQRSVVRVTIALMLAQSLSSAAYSSSVAVNQLAIVDMTGSKLLGGLPSAIVLAGSSVMAYFSGRMVSRHGRRNILTMGTALGLLGAFIAAGGVVLQSLAVFLGGLAVLGFGRGTLDQSRYVAAEITTPDKRARALSFVVWGATIGAVGGPLVAPFASEIGKRFGFNLYFGPMIETGLLYGIAGIMIFLLLALDLRGLTSRVAAASAATDEARESARAAVSKPTTPDRSFLTALRETPDARTALIAMVCGQTAMALMMSCVSIYMKDHNHGLADISLVISTHTFGMFFFRRWWAS